MKPVRSLLTVVMFTLAAASAAQAGSKIMATAPAARTYPSNQQIDCNIINLNTTPKLVTAEVMDYSGVVVMSLGPIELAPSTGVSTGDAADFGAWCRFTVDGSTKKYRAVATYKNFLTNVYNTAVVAK